MGQDSKAIGNRQNSILFAFFRDSDPRHTYTGEEFNKAGYVTLSGSIIHLQGRRLVESSKARIRHLNPKIVSVPFSAAECEAAEFLFTRKPRDPDLFSAGMSALMEGRILALTNSVRPIVFDALSEEEHRNRWDQLLQVAKKADFIFTFNTASWTSRVIAWVDNGSWSHTALYSGENTVLEAITSGTCERPIDVYRTPNFRVGLYRIPLEDGKDEKGIEWLRSRIGDGYSYRGALIAGAEKLFCLQRKKRTPNDMMMVPNIQLIALV